MRPVILADALVADRHEAADLAGVIAQQPCHLAEGGGHHIAVPLALVEAEVGKGDNALVRLARHGLIVAVIGQSGGPAEGSLEIPADLVEHRCRLVIALMELLAQLEIDSLVVTLFCDLVLRHACCDEILQYGHIIVPVAFGERGVLLYVVEIVID